MSRIKDLQKYVHRDLESMKDIEKYAKAMNHLHGVSFAAVIIAKKRGVNSELAAMAGLLHDVYAYKNGSYDDHAHLGADYARARDMIDHDVAVALATDFNPGSCPCLNMQLVMNLGCLRYKMTPEEVLNAVTLNAAAAIDRADVLGSIEPGKYADILIWDAYDLNYIFYRLGSNLIAKVIKKGRLVVDHEKQGER